MAVSAPGAALNASQDVVQEFQISTINMDLATSLTTNGSINIVMVETEAYTSELVLTNTSGSQ